MRRGEIWWAELPAPVGASPGFRRPVLLIQADSFNRSRLQTVIVAIITSNLRLANAPANVFISTHVSGLPKDSVINLSQLISADKSMLVEQVSTLSQRKLQQVNSGLRLILSLDVS